MEMERLDCLSLDKTNRIFWHCMSHRIMYPRNPYDTTLL